ncbi:hypothetical protein [Kitasatospora sp. MBT63]|uniref:hypothetical protein n=1 Tax=Kitasatospora sp. MBT63 TaxID=1444768 RepID=UPI000539AA88|nr:hypothetical protein [Kitasatospora sp. MBT63]
MPVPSALQPDHDLAQRGGIKGVADGLMVVVGGLAGLVGGFGGTAGDVAAVVVVVVEPRPGVTGLARLQDRAEPGGALPSGSVAAMGVVPPRGRQRPGRFEVRQLLGDGIVAVFVPVVAVRYRGLVPSLEFLSAFAAECFDYRGLDPTFGAL